MDCEIKLTLKVKGVEIELSPKDAEGLYEALGKLVSKKEKEYTYPIYPWGWYPWTYNSYPYTVWWSGSKSDVSLAMGAT